ncbi:TatD family hydrolase [Salinicola rhizosphaerae]|uniref:Metal-dependent hydrolase n=1 Tax=Salinicola rhizosphaerae TaxID=1443141 RepID=A0ABQ3DNS6_9GAMM|nr:TatD family hydrolase [Salinicola rhizosphaerae]GHB09544.1 metal-dependent hydrolase [Salinicola rhizosphaerae]
MSASTASGGAPALFDAHCHLDFDVFDADRDAVFARARAAGVSRFMVPGTTRARWAGVKALAGRADVVVSLGLHPYFIDAHGDDDIQALEHELQTVPGLVGIGECGIDARFEQTLTRQWALFEAQLQLARRARLPVVIHCVHADDQVAKRLRQLDLPARGLIHAFGGSEQQARRFVDLGYTLGLGGALTYSRAQRLHRVVRSLPDEAFVLETDSPDMPLSGYQGQRNEPARLIETLDHVAHLRRQAPGRVAELARRNAQRLFGLGSHCG